MKSSAYWRKKSKLLISYKVINCINLRKIVGGITKGSSRKIAAHCATVVENAKLN